MSVVSISPDTKSRPLDLPEIFVLEESPRSGQLNGSSLDGGNSTRLLDEYRDYWLIVIHGHDLCDRRS